MDCLDDFVELLKELPLILALILLEVLYFFEDMVLKARDREYALLFSAELASLAFLALKPASFTVDALFAALFAAFISLSIWLGRKKKQDFIYPLQSTVLLTLLALAIMATRALL
jgi:hypothetical protein